MELRKRYVCSVCGAEIVVITATDSVVECHNLRMELKRADTQSIAVRPAGGAAQAS
jgi:hypothetical protein